MTEKKKYEKPSTRVIELQQRMMLLAGSAKSGQLDDLDDYLLEDDPFQFAPQLTGEPNPFDF